MRYCNLEHQVNSSKTIYNQLYMGQHCNANIFIARKISILKLIKISNFAFFVWIRLNQNSLVCDKTITDKTLRN